MNTYRIIRPDGREEKIEATSFGYMGNCIEFYADRDRIASIPNSYSVIRVEKKKE